MVSAEGDPGAARRPVGAQELAGRLSRCLAQRVERRRFWLRYALIAEQTDGKRIVPLSWGPEGRGASRHHRSPWSRGHGVVPLSDLPGEAFSALPTDRFPASLSAYRQIFASLTPPRRSSTTP